MLRWVRVAKDPPESILCFCRPRREVGARQKVFTQFDTKKELSLTLQQVKRVFERGPLNEKDRKQFAYLLFLMRA